MKRNIVKRLTLVGGMMIMGLGLSACTNRLGTDEQAGGLTTPAAGQKFETKAISPTATAAPPKESTLSAMPNRDDKIIDEATIVTDKGSITVALFPEETPGTVKNFSAKARSGFYEGLIFHRVEDWVIQGGDPLGNGIGGGKMPTELSRRPFKLGSLGVARGEDRKISNDAQFFICTKDCPWLTEEYTNFGEVKEGMEVVGKIEIGDKIIRIEMVE